MLIVAVSYVVSLFCINNIISGFPITSLVALLLMCFCCHYWTGVLCLFLAVQWFVDFWKPKVLSPLRSMHMERSGLSTFGLRRCGLFCSMCGPRKFCQRGSIYNNVFFFVVCFPGFYVSFFSFLFFIINELIKIPLKADLNRPASADGPPIMSWQHCIMAWFLGDPYLYC